MRKLWQWTCLVFALAMPLAADALQFVEGATGPGTRYGIWMPDVWNGDLVLYAHGFRNPDCPTAIPTTPEAICLGGDSGTPQAVRPTRDALLALGYAFAASSYADTGLALKDGAQRTFQLKGLFTAEFGAPRRTYLYGHSMGGAIVLKLAEKHPTAFDGALAACGMIGGSPEQFTYVADARATFDALFPGVVRGGFADVPPDLDYFGEVVPAVLALFDPRNPSFQQNMARAMAWAALDQIKFPYTTPQELVKGILELLYFQVQGTPGVLAAAHGIPVDNGGVLYSGPAWLATYGVDLATLNAAVERVTSDPQAVAWSEHEYETTGAIAFPVLTLHTTRDAAVPMRHEGLYAEKVSAAGRSELLVQRSVWHAPDPRSPDGHCTFKPAEELAAFAALVEWVETGARPAGGDATVP
jgi:pimeloyl-ACP methyl ester carboxylesterase